MLFLMLFLSPSECLFNTLYTYVIIAFSHFTIFMSQDSAKLSHTMGQKQHWKIIHKVWRILSACVIIVCNSYICVCVCVYWRGYLKKNIST